LIFYGLETKWRWYRKPKIDTFEAMILSGASPAVPMGCHGVMQPSVGVSVIRIYLLDLQT